MTRPRPEHEGEPARTTLAPEEEAKPVEPSGAAAPRPADYPREVRQRAAVILEVLAGVRSPTEAAQVLSLSVSQYYVLEEKALAAVVAACAPQAPGRKPDAERRCAQLEQECQRWQRECARQQALVRAAQRTIGLPAPPPAAARQGGRKPRKRRPVVRALRAAARLRPADEAAAAAPGATAPPPSD